MDVVLIRVHGLDVERRVFLARLVEYGLERRLHARRFEPFDPILRAPDDMVLEFVGGMVEGSRLHGTGLRFAPGLIHPRARAPAWHHYTFLRRALARGFL